MSAISTTSQSKVKKLPPEPVSDDEPVQPKKKKVVKNPEDCIKVYCRVRPPEANEESAKGISIIEGEHTMVFVNDDPGRPVSKKYTFTELFKDESQEYIISKLCDPVLDAVKNHGKGGLIFTYGVTNSGKTHTVLGNDKEPGILQYLFAAIPKPFQLTAVEVYNDEFWTLLLPRIKISLIEYSGRLQFRDYTPIQVTQSNMETIIQDIKQGRSIRSTSFNSKSSRSHAIIRIKAYGNVIGVVDLAGSERVREGCSQEQTTSINCSLLSLGRCIKYLRQARHDRQVQIPFRQSRLTMALAQYFNPQFKLVMVININPSKSMINETLNVLDYAAIARDIKPSQTPTKSRYKNIASQSKIILEQTKSQDFDCKKSQFRNLFSGSKMQSQQKTYEEVLQEQNRHLREYILKLEMERLKKQYNDRVSKNFEEANREVDRYIKEEKEITKNYLKQFGSLENINMSNINLATQNTQKIPTPYRSQSNMVIQRVSQAECGVNTSPPKERLSAVKQEKEQLEKQFERQRKELKRQLEQLQYSQSFHESLHKHELEQQIYKFNEEKKEMEDLILEKSEKKRCQLEIQKRYYEVKIEEMNERLENMKKQHENKIAQMEKLIGQLNKASIFEQQERKSGILDMIASPFKSVKKGFEVVMRKLSPSKPQIRAQSCEQDKSHSYLRQNRKVHFNDKDQINQLETIQENHEGKQHGRRKSRGKSLDKGKSKKSVKSNKSVVEVEQDQQERTPLKDRLRPRKKH